MEAQQASSHVQSMQGRTYLTRYEPRMAPPSWAAQYSAALMRLIFLVIRNAAVTAGFRWPPVMHRLISARWPSPLGSMMQG